MIVSHQSQRDKSYAWPVFLPSLRSGEGLGVGLRKSGRRIYPPPRPIIPLLLPAPAPRAPVRERDSYPEPARRAGCSDTPWP
jgi:hypothetical protein